MCTPIRGCRRPATPQPRDRRERDRGERDDPAAHRLFMTVELVEHSVERREASGAIGTDDVIPNRARCECSDHADVRGRPGRARVSGRAPCRRRDAVARLEPAAARARAAPSSRATPSPSKRQPPSHMTTSRDRRCALSAATASVTRRPTLHVAVSVLADEDDRHRVERDPDEECSTHSAALRLDRDEREVERYHERRLDHDEIEAKRRQERDRSSGRVRRDPTMT